jgi:hypothetical protein
MRDQKAMQAIVVPGTQDLNQTPMLLQLFDEQGQPLDISGSVSTQVHFLGAGNTNVENNDLPHDVDVGELPPGDPGVYLVKLSTEWPGVSPTNGGAGARVSHYDGEGQETILCFLELNTLHNGEGYGDTQLGPNGGHARITDFGVVSVPGELKVQLNQNTDLHPIEAFVTVEIVKL